MFDKDIKTSNEIKDKINKETEEGEYLPFNMIKELYPRYLFTLDLLLQKKMG